MAPTHALQIAYDGSSYAGWQRQENAVSVQQRIEEAVAELTARTPSVVGSGRTDAGVHSTGQVAHTTFPGGWGSRNVVLGLNSHLPADIRVLAAREIRPDFHAQRSATAKTYLYRLSAKEVLDPFEARRSVRIRATLDLQAVRRASSALQGTHDFASFAKSGGSHDSAVRTVFRLDWTRAGELIELQIEGDGFLRGMVRALVGTLLEVGEGRRDAGSMHELLAAKDRTLAGPNAPACGLELARVDYPEELFVGPGWGLWRA